MTTLSKAHTNWKVAFLEALAKVPVVQFAADAAGVQRCTVYRARESDPAFAKDWDDAMEAGVDKAEREAFRRAVEGWEEPVIAQGRLVRDEEGNVFKQRKHSDSLLALVLKARRKRVYAERTEVTDGDGNPLKAQPTIIVTGVPRDDLKPEDFA